MRPNQDITQALAGIGIRNGRIEGIGSFIGTAFANGQGLDSYATEMLVLEGRIVDGVPRLRVASVGFDGKTASGWLAPGANPICVTAELLIIADSVADFAW
jgi:hypothetical protein